MRQRVRLMADALATAAASPSIDPDALKVFIAPEFFFRGPVGSYDVNVVFVKLRELYDAEVKKNMGFFDGWMFDFDTMIGHASPAAAGDFVVYNLAPITRADKSVVAMCKQYKSTIDFFKDPKLGKLADGEVRHLEGAFVLRRCEAVPSVLAVLRAA